jgi:DNA-binding response OmpR family regulator
LTKRILAVDDDPSTRTMLCDYLSKQDYDVVTATNGKEMRGLLEGGDIDLVLLDVKMPGEDGFALARDLRARSHVPIIMLTGQGDEVDRVLGLELGADDYLTKPFSPRELLARIRAVLRRHELATAAAEDPGVDPTRREPRAYRFAGWELNTGTRRLTSPRAELIELTNAEYSLLVTFMRSPRKVLSRDQLIGATRMHADVFDRSIDVGILRLRRKIEKNSNAPNFIRAERSVGYFFDADVTVVR